MRLFLHVFHTGTIKDLDADIFELLLRTSNFEVPHNIAKNPSESGLRTGRFSNLQSERGIVKIASTLEVACRTQRPEYLEVLLLARVAMTCFGDPCDPP